MFPTPLRDSSLVALLAIGSTRRGALSRQTQVLVDDELAGDGVGGGTEGKANDDGWNCVRRSKNLNGRWVSVYRGGTAQEGSA